MALHNKTRTKQRTPTMGTAINMNQQPEWTVALATGGRGLNAFSGTKYSI